MKKILLAAAVCALASFNSFAADCGAVANGYATFTLGSFDQTPCQVTNGSYQWNLSNLYVFDTSSNTFGSPSNTTIANNLTVAINAAGSNGFSLTYTLSEPYN